MATVSKEIVLGTTSSYKSYVFYEVTQNISANTSTVKAYLRVKKIDTNSSSYNPGMLAYLTLQGTKTSVKYNFDMRTASVGTVRTLTSRTATITHDSNGNGSFTVAASFSSQTSGGGNFTLDTTKVTLPKIARTSTISLSSSSVTLGSYIDVSITRANSGYYHMVYYRFGNINKLISDNATTSARVQTSISDCSEIPNAKSGSGTITVETYTNSSLSTYIGKTSKSITLNVPSSVKPSFSSLSSEVIDSGAGTGYGYVQGKSKCKLTVNSAAGMYGSTIKSHVITGGGLNTNAIGPHTTGVLNTSGNITFTAKVLDSRGVYSDAKSITINVQPYSNPTISKLSSVRCLQNGIIDNEGTYARTLVTYSYSPLNGNNTLQSVVEYKSSNASSWVNAGYITSDSAMVIGNGSLNTGDTYDIRVTISDRFTSVSKLVSIATAFVLFSYKKGGRAVGVGKVPQTSDIFDIGLQTIFEHTPKVGNNLIYHQGHKPYKSDVGLGNVNNWGASSDVNNNSTTTYATTNMVAQVKAMINSSGSVSGWSNISIVSGISSRGQNRVRKHNSKLVELQLFLTGATSVPKKLATIPSGFRPDKELWFTGCVGDTTHVGRFSIGTDGSVTLEKVPTGSIASGYGIQLNCMWSIN